jgi:hypothetical protein
MTDHPASLVPEHSPRAHVCDLQEPVLPDAFRAHERAATPPAPHPTPRGYWAGGPDSSSLITGLAGKPLVAHDSRPRDRCRHRLDTMPSATPVRSVAGCIGDATFLFLTLSGDMVSIAIVSFAYMTAHAPTGFRAELEILERGCRWRDELVRTGNPFACFRPIYQSAPLDPPRRADGICGGPLIEHLFDAHTGANAKLDIDEAKQMARVLLERVAQGRGCGDGTPARTLACFSHATMGNAMQANEAGKFAGCVLGHERDHCRAIVCSV